FLYLNDEMDLLHRPFPVDSGVLRQRFDNRSCKATTISSSPTNCASSKSDFRNFWLSRLSTELARVLISLTRPLESRYISKKPADSSDRPRRRSRSCN